MKLSKVLLFIILFCALIIAASCTKYTINKKTTTIQKSKAQMERRIRWVTIDSKTLNRPIRVNVYLPLGYTDKKKYPVLYLLPGGNGSQNFCIPGLEIEQSADLLIKANKINPLIIVSPEIDNSLGLNSSEKYYEYKFFEYKFNFGRYEDYLSKELVEYIDTHFSTIASRKGRYIGGMSTGGYIALRLAFRHPNEYSKVGGHSPDIPHKLPNKKIAHMYFPNKKELNNGNILYLAEKNPIKNLNIYLDDGNKDEYKFYIYCSELYKILLKRGVNVKYYLNNGHHASVYWKSQMNNYLEFYSGK